jgi:hypothetical protein
MRIAVEVDEAEFIEKLRQWHDPERLAAVDYFGYKQIEEPYTYFWLGNKEAFGRRRGKDGIWRGGWGDAIPPAVFARFGLAAVLRAGSDGTAELPLAWIMQ